MSEKNVSKDDLRQLIKDSQKLEIMANNISDGLMVPFKPFDDNYAISDLRVKLDVFEYALEGLKDRSSHSVIEHKDILNLFHYWLNISINMEQALSLLEYTEYALMDEDVVEFEDVKNAEFPLTRVKSALKERRDSENHRGK